MCSPLAVLGYQERGFSLLSSLFQSHCLYSSSVWNHAQWGVGISPKEDSGASGRRNVCWEAHVHTHTHTHTQIKYRTNKISSLHTRSWRGTMSSTKWLKNRVVPYIIAFSTNTIKCYIIQNRHLPSGNFFKDRSVWRKEMSRWMDVPGQFHQKAKLMWILKDEQGTENRK